VTPAPLLAVLVLALPAAPTYVLNLGAGTEARVREPGDPTADNPDPERAFDADLGARAELGIEFDRVNLTLSYEPLLSFTNFTEQNTSALLHTAGLGSSMKFKRAELALSQRISYGQRTFTSLSGGGATVQATDGANQPPTTDGSGTIDGGGMLPGGTGGTGGTGGSQTGTTQQVGLLPGATTADYYSSETSGSLSYTLSRRSTLGFSLTYFAGGGTDEDSRLTVPFAFGPSIGVQYRYALTRVDGLSTTAQAEWRSTSTASTLPDTESEIAGVMESWQRRWGPNTDSELGVGLSVIPGFTGDSTFAVHPVAKAAASHSEIFGPHLNKNRPKLTTRVSIETTVQIDQLTGLADRRLILGAGVSWVRTDWTIQGLVDHQRSIGDAGNSGNSVVVTNGDIGARYEIIDELDLGFGYRAQYQTIGNPTTIAASAAPDGWRTVAYVNLTLTLDPIDL
jgi:hypothetical protein